MVRHCIAVLLLFAVAAGAAAAGPAGLDVRVDPILEKSAAGTGQVRYTLTNSGDNEVLVLRWQTALEGVNEDVFRVQLGSKAVTYIGRHYKRGTPQAADYIVLGAGETRSAVVDLTAYYDMREAGQYAVEVDVELDNAFREDPRGLEKVAPLASEALRSPRAFVWVDGAHVTPEPDLSWLAGAKATSFVGCSNTRQNSINTAVNSAKSYASNSSAYLNAGTVGSRYTTWFGTYLSSRYATVKSHFVAIGDALNNKPLVFDCSCTDPYYAYVYPSQPYRVYLCNAFWSAPNTGTDSRAGTIIHEISHFNVVAATDDHAYGHTAAKRLATKSPNKAVDNADSHEYFAENTPELQ